MGRHCPEVQTFTLSHILNSKVSYPVFHDFKAPKKVPKAAKDYFSFICVQWPGAIPMDVTGVGVFVRLVLKETP